MDLPHAQAARHLPSRGLVRTAAASSSEHGRWPDQLNDVGRPSDGTATTDCGHTSAVVRQAWAGARSRKAGHHRPADPRGFREATLGQTARSIRSVRRGREHGTRIRNRSYRNSRGSRRHVNSRRSRSSIGRGQPARPTPLPVRPRRSHAPERRRGRGPCARDRHSARLPGGREQARVHATSPRGRPRGKSRGSR